NNARIDRFRIPPMAAGNFNVYGGIYRDVRIMVKDRLHIPFQGSADHEGGTFVTTPDIRKEKSAVRVRTWVRNDHAEICDCTLLTTILDPDGKQAQSIKTARHIEPGKTLEFDQTTPPIANPHLWSLETPFVYTVISEVMAGDRLADRFESPLGFRWFRWDKAEQRLYLNDRPVDIHGTNRHQEYPWLGDAIPKWISRMDMDDIRHNLNHNFMRTAHYSHDSIIYDYADRQGIIICEEVPNIKNQDFNTDVQRQQAKEMIRRDRNHPSIFFWSVGNETDHAADSAWIVAEDTTRIVHARCVEGPSAGKFVTHTHEDMNMEQLLKCTIRGWYDDDVKNLPGTTQVTGNEELQHSRALANEGLTWRHGVMWLYEDHGADREYANSPLKHVNPKGWVDSWRIPKYMYYLWQANHAEKPMVFIHPHYWRSQYLGQNKDFI
ncbi:MAG: glycoside hydrolase family 2 TIM barrel-domain containing protein, partial [Kiritimatiellota bacterium]|nr:glycoside hydrolase family 2 TIM barrel-domain containing protein [Kiritimatiellota bacterium]